MEEEYFIHARVLSSGPLFGNLNGKNKMLLMRWVLEEIKSHWCVLMKHGNFTVLDGVNKLTNTVIYISFFQLLDSKNIDFYPFAITWKLPEIAQDHQVMNLRWWSVRDWDLTRCNKLFTEMNFNVFYKIYGFVMEIFYSQWIVNF